MNQENSIFSSNTRKPISGDFKIDIKLPPQFPSKAEAEVIATASNTAQAAVGVNVVFLVCLQLAVGKAVKKILPLFFTIQFVLAFQKFRNIMLPPTINTILTSITDALEINAIPKEEIQELILPGDTGEELFKSGGNLLLIIPLIIFAVLMVILLGICCKKVACCIKLVDKVKASLFFNGIIAGLMPTALPFCVTAGFGRNLSKNPTSTPSNPVMLGLVLAQLFGFILFIRCHQKEKLLQPSTQQKFSILYESYRY